MEARNRTGGRVLSIGGHEMGPSWFWEHQTYILELIHILGLESFEQYSLGDALYDEPDGVQRFSAPPSARSYRLRGGISSIITVLEDTLHTPVRMNEKVTSLTYKKGSICVKTELTTYSVDKVISTLPPRLAIETILYSPALSSKVEAQLKNIPTWMGYAAKCVIEYAHSFWREEGLSGLTISHVGPLGEIHDACTEEKAALFGFLQSNASFENIKERIIGQLVRLYGEKASSPLQIYLVDWKKEVYTSSIDDAQPLSSHPKYGFELTHFDNNLIFAGTEGAVNEGGYLEGAVNKSALVCKRLLKK